ncbi:uncharacterized protein LAESUDRAFT_714528 [Laetiporus sulphureus 93-53]|uniref:Retrotransposon gag domain-containing protein n=1 Tax=Laetiporus sulphureus 93-53 TaxID=1314785 RepID=A0A165E3I6_9APHY|nr:uncharacterized protein LAESUDRAFT_714528 [Laetiporus sulphureus 93-53]KZT06183.1 hypothetical protein LAESUDRAFT_714528 [Laetiporus sulphureus 93-53]
MVKTLDLAGMEAMEARVLNDLVKEVKVEDLVELGTTLPENTVLKNIKDLPKPNKYDGEDNREMFDSWLKSLLRWMCLTRLGGPNLDEECLQMLGQYLKGAASEWYNDTIDDIDVDAQLWSFVEALCMLFRQFLHFASTISAADHFEVVMYLKQGGVVGLHDTLTKYAKCMPIPPDDYAFAHQFMDTLPDEIHVPLLCNQNVLIEGTKFQDLLQLAH